MPGPTVCRSKIRYSRKKLRATFAGKDVIGADEAVQKIRAAVDARSDEDFVIVARTDARAVLGFDAAMDRARAFIEAGADVTFVEAPEKP